MAEILDQTRVLLCDSNAAFGILLADFLRRLDFDVELCDNGEDGLTQFKKRQYDICLLDINLPDKNGFELLEDIRKMGNDTPVVFLTERKANEDILRAYELGCDDYIFKPCAMDILLCKIRAILRRTQLSKKNNEVEFDLGNGIRFDSVRQVLGDLQLPSRESDLLLILCRNSNRIVERNLILRALWQQESYFTGRSLCVYVNHLRKHLAGTRVHIMNVHGKGYKLVYDD